MPQEEACCKAVVLAVNGRDQTEYAAAFGAVEALVSEERGEELCASMLVALHDNLRGLVEGGREWEEEVSSSKLSVLFKLLHQLVRLLTKTGQRLPFVGGWGGAPHSSGAAAGSSGGGSGSGAPAGGGYSPFEPFALCAVCLAQLQVDVGRRMDLTSSVTEFLKRLALYDADFQKRLIDSAFHARSDLLAQAVVEQAVIDPKPLFQNIAARLLRILREEEHASKSGAYPKSRPLLQGPSRV
jgi:hypothetical protein